MKIFNTYTNKLEEFVPIHEGKVNMYVCGPTVYNYIHIGNARPVIFFDTVRKYFEHRGFEVKFASNFTDVDDKIITKALELEVAEREVSEKFIAAFLADVERVHSSTDYIKPKVTNYMDQIINYIELLVDKGFAYEVDGDVYFRVEYVKDYGQLSNRNVQDLISGARIEVNNKKENPLDFTLWKKTDVGIQFDSRFGKGRPGWHTECVAMIDNIFGEKIDIHGGGSGLMFPHHENEIAQSKVLHGHSIANYWMHNGLLNIQGSKMSKSEGKMILVKDLIVDTNAFRLFTLSTHYRSPINYTDESLENYVKEWDKITRIYKSIYLKLDLADMIYANAKINPDLLLIYKNFLTAMDNDFNTANAITAMQDLTKLANQMIRSNTEPEILLSVLKVYNDFFEVLGLKIEVSPLSKEDKEVYKNWENARKEKDFASADKFRAVLQRKRYCLMTQLSGATLAYIGDAIYEVLVREYLIKKGYQKVDNLHKEAIKYTSAVGQNKAVNQILDLLSEDEASIFKRGRNVSGNRKAKNASIIEYRQATGLEALFGFLYLDKEFDRIYELLDYIIKEK